MSFDDPIEAREQSRRQALVRRVLASALRGLSVDDRRLLALRYRQHYTVQALARLVRTDPKALYRRLDRIRRDLRKSLEQGGVLGLSTIDTP